MTNFEYVQEYKKIKNEVIETVNKKIENGDHYNFSGYYGKLYKIEELVSIELEKLFNYQEVREIVKVYNDLKRSQQEKKQLEEEILNEIKESK